MLRIDVLTIFPELFEPFLERVDGRHRGAASGQRRGRGARPARLDRRTATAASTTRPTAGAPGMVMKPEPLVAAIEALAGGPRARAPRARGRCCRRRARRLEQAQLPGIARAERRWCSCAAATRASTSGSIELAVDEELSLGDYVLSGGEVPAMVIIEGVVRLLPGVLGNPESARAESFQAGLLEGPQYTRPAEFRGRSRAGGAALGGSRGGGALAQPSGRSRRRASDGPISGLRAAARSATRKRDEERERMNRSTAHPVAAAPRVATCRRSARATPCACT